MLYLVVLLTMGALVVGILVGRHLGTVARPQSTNDAAVDDAVPRNGAVSPDSRASGQLADLAPEPGLLRGLRPEERTSDDADAVTMEQTWQDFVANVSHELKTPVGAVALLAEAVLDATDDPQEVHRFGTKILNEANRLGTLVTELIALSRLQSADWCPERATVAVDEMVRAALDRCRLAAEAANIRITVDPPSGLLLDGEETLLITALSNLLDNAVSYSTPGSPVSVHRRLEHGFVEIAVTDHGLGIAAENQQRVFERFFRIDQARSRSTVGTGLGLAIVKHVAAIHGGNVQLWSKPGTGSTFTLRIPAHPHSVQPTPCTPSIPEHIGGSLTTTMLTVEERRRPRPPLANPRQTADEYSPSWAQF